MEFSGDAAEEVGRCCDTGKVWVRVSKTYYRPTEVDLLIGDASKARERLGWNPQTTFKELVSKMTKEDILLAERERQLGKG